MIHHAVYIAIGLHFSRKLLVKLRGDERRKVRLMATLSTDGTWEFGLSSLEDFNRVIARPLGGRIAYNLYKE